MCEVDYWNIIEKLNWKTASLICEEFADENLRNMAKSIQADPEFETWVSQKVNELDIALCNYNSCMFGSAYKFPVTGEDYTDMLYHIVGCGHYEYDSCISTPAIIEMLYIDGTTRYKKGFKKIISFLKKK